MRWGTLTSTNSALLSDGALFQIDPSSLTRVYSLESLRVVVRHELSPRWRAIVGVESWVSATLQQAPIVLSPTNQITHTGLDYVDPAVDVTLSHDLDPYNVGSLYARYQYSYVPYFLDYARVPPAYDGSSTVQIGSVEARWTHAFSEYFRSLLMAGLAVSQAPQFNADQSPVLSPLASAMVTYSRRSWYAAANPPTTLHGSTMPTFGFGPAVGGGFTLQGIPVPHGSWNALSVVANGTASRAQFLQGPGETTTLSFVAAGADVRYSLTNWLGLDAGYSFRYSTFEGSNAFLARPQRRLHSGSPATSTTTSLPHA